MKIDFLKGEQEQGYSTGFRNKSCQRNAFFTAIYTQGVPKMVEFLLVGDAVEV